jgi:D-alanine-D-alanine ligase
MRKLRVLVLMHEDLVPPDSLEGYSEKEIAEWATEYDVVTGLRELGHEVFQQGVGSDLGAIRNAFNETQAHIAFNLLVHFHGVAVYDQHVVSYMELLKKQYTGCNPRGLLLARDKALSKELMSLHRIRVPKSHVFPRGRKTRRPRKLDFPLLVKSVAEEASLGISQTSVVTNDQKLAERVEFMHETFNVDVLGNHRLQTLPVWELPLDQLPDGAPRIATAKVKWDLDYQQKYEIETHRADIPKELEAEIGKLAKRIHRVLGLTGYCRIDLRLAPDGKVYVLEANPNPDLKVSEDFAESAKAEGIAYPDLLQRILNLGMSYPAEWKKNEAV